MSKKMIGCKTCGKIIAKNAKKCPFCGAKNSGSTWWVWLILIIIIGGAIGANNSNKESNTNDRLVSDPTTGQNTAKVVPSESNTAESKNTIEEGWYPSGTYKVGTDIEAGEYLIVATDYSCYVEVSKDSSGKFDSIVSNENFTTRMYYRFLDGQYLKVRGGKFAKSSNVAPYEPTNNVYPEGMYHVGKDIAPGEYKITANDSNCYFEVDSNSLNIFGSIVSNENISLGETAYIKVSPGQYLKIRGGQITIPGKQNGVDSTTKAAEETSTEKNDGWIPSGMYKVGVDISAGEYLVVATDRNCYIEVSNDSTGKFESIVSNENVTTRIYYTVLDGQYLKVRDGKFTLSSNVNPFESKDNVYPDGMYLVGKDIAPGEYKITANDSNCYFEVDSNSFNIFDSIISNENISLGESAYITLIAGQYIKLRGGQIIVQ